MRDETLDWWMNWIFVIGMGGGLALGLAMMLLVTVQMFRTVFGI